MRPTMDLSDVWHCFNCLSPKTNITSTNTQESLVLFDHKFDYASTLISNTRTLFQLARECLMLIDCGPQLYLQSLGTNRHTESSLSDADYYSKLRKQICDFLAYLLSSIDILTSGDENLGRLFEKVISPFTEHLCKFRLLAERLGFIQAYTNQSHDAMGSQSSYHKLHSHLDVCWCHLNLFIKLDDYREITKLFQNSQAPGVHEISFEKYVVLFMSDLLLVAIANYEKSLLPTELLKTSPFNCTCVRQLWGKLVKLLDARYEQKKSKMDFWLFLNPMLDSVGTEPSTRSDLAPTMNSAELGAPVYLACREPIVFKFWILSHLASLCEEGVVVQANCIKLESILKEYVVPDSLISEEDLQIIIPLVTPLLSEVWQSRSEGVMILWEYFHRRLNTGPQLSRDTPHDSLPSNGKSSMWLEQIRSRLEKPATCEDSWSLFLRLLGLHLQKSGLKQWQKLRGRIYSKFSLMKLQGLTELGLCNVSCLFLTLCLAENVEEVSMKFVDLLSLLNPRDELRRHVLWKAHLMILQLYLSRKLDIQPIVQPLMVELNNASLKDDTISLGLVRMLVDEIQDILKAFSDLSLSMHLLIDDWIPQYLARCSETDASKLYAVILTLVEKVSALCMNDPSADATNMSESLWKHVLPCVLSSSPSCYNVKASLGYELTLLALHNRVTTRSVSSIFCRFINSQSLDVQIGQRYLCLLMTNRMVMNSLQAKMDSYQGLIVRSWLRCVILSVDNSSEDLFALTRHVSELPEIVQLATNQRTRLSEDQDSLNTFLTLINNASSLHSTRINFYVSQVPVHLTRTPLTSIQIATRIFKCAAAFILLAPRLSYNSAPTSKNLLTSVMDNLLLPAAIHNPSFKLKLPEYTAISATLVTFVRGLVALAPQSDHYINKCLRDLIVQYLPRLVFKPAIGNTLDVYLEDTLSHPLLEVFEDLQAEGVSEPSRFVTEIVSSLMVCKGRAPQNHTLLALRFLQAALRKGNGSQSVVRVVTQCALANILDVVTFVEGTHVVHQKALEVLQTLLLNQSDDKRRLQVLLVVRSTKKNLAFHAPCVFGLLERLARLDRQLVELSMPQVKELVEAVEQMRGAGTDRCLRSGLDKIKNAIRK